MEEDRVIILGNFGNVMEMRRLGRVTIQKKVIVV